MVRLRHDALCLSPCCALTSSGQSSCPTNEHLVNRGSDRRKGRRRLERHGNVVDMSVTKLDSAQMGKERQCADEGSFIFMTSYPSFLSLRGLVAPIEANIANDKSSSVLSALNVNTTVLRCPEVLRLLQPPCPSDGDEDDSDGRAAAAAAETSLVAAIRTCEFDAVVKQGYPPYERATKHQHNSDWTLSRHDCPKHQLHGSCSPVMPLLRRPVRRICKQTPGCGFQDHGPVRCFS